MFPDWDGLFDVIAPGREEHRGAPSELHPSLELWRWQDGNGDSPRQERPFTCVMAAFLWSAVFKEGTEVRGQSCMGDGHTEVTWQSLPSRQDKHAHLLASTHISKIFLHCMSWWVGGAHRARMPSPPCVDNTLIVNQPQNVHLTSKTSKPTLMLLQRNSVITAAGGWWSTAPRSAPH